MTPFPGAMAAGAGKEGVSAEEMQAAMRGVEDEADAAAAAALEQENAAELAEFTAEVCLLPAKCRSPHALQWTLSRCRPGQSTAEEGLIARCCQSIRV